MSTALRRAAVWVSAASVCVLVASCKDATAMSLAISTDVPCSAAVQVSVTAGAGTNVENVPPSVVTAQCEAGRIGTLTLVPNANKGARITVRVVLAPNGDVEACNAQNQYAGCIVARRALSYVSAKALRVPISMYALCKDVPCTATSTCARTGLCVAADCSVRGEECVVEDERPDPRADAASDVLATNDGSTGIDGSSSDGGNVRDGAASDGGRDAGDPGGMAGVFCPGPVVPIQCLVNEYCCYDAMTARGACATSFDECTATSARPLRCDDGADCIGMSGTICCTESFGMVNSSACFAETLCNAQGGKVLCANVDDCPRIFGFTQCVPYFGPYKRCI